MNHAGAVIVALLMSVAASRTAAAQQLTVDEVKGFVLAVTEPVRGMDPPSAEQRTAVVAQLATPFWYDGLRYAALDAAAMKACRRRFKAAGTVKPAARLPGFVDCLQIALFSGALDGDAEWTAVDVKQLPRPFKKHRTKLATLAKDHSLVISHFVPAGPAEHWDLWAVKRDAAGKPRLAALLVVNLDHQ